MTSNLVELVNEYYEARKPYTQLVREAHASLPYGNSSAQTHASTTESCDTVQSQQEPEFSMSPKIPHDEITNVLKKLEALKVEYAQAGKSTGKASVGKKGRATVEKK